MFHGWKVVGAGAALMALQGALILQVFGSYAVILREQFGWSKTTISVAYSFTRAESGLLGPVHGWMLERWGTRRLMLLGASMMFVGFTWLSQMSSPVHFVLSFLTIAIGASFAGYLTLATETVRWFERKRTRALSVMTGGFAVGGFAVPAVVWCMRELGWRETAFASGIALTVVTASGAAWFGSSPEQRGVPIDGIQPDARPPEITIYNPADGDLAAELENASTTSHGGDDMSARQAMQTRAFWMLAFGQATALLVVGTVMAHVSLYLVTEQSYSLQRASFVIAGITISQTAGMALAGVLGDRLNKRVVCAAAMLGHSAGLLLLTFAISPAMIWAFTLLHGLAWGIRGPLQTALRADYFGASHFGQIMGYTSLVLAIGTVGGPILAGALADATGDYRLGFTLLAIMAALGSLLYAGATPPSTVSSVSARSRARQKVRREIG